MQLYELMHSKFKTRELEELAAELHVDYEDLAGSSRKLKALNLQEYMSSRVRLGELLAALWKKPDVSDSELRPFLYLLIASLFPNEQTIRSLFTRLQIPKLRDFGGPEKFSWGSTPWRQHKAQALQQYMEENGRADELVEAILEEAEKRNIELDLRFYDAALAKDETIPQPESGREEIAPAEVVDEYLNFDLRMRQVGDKYDVEVLHSPMGEIAARQQPLAWQDSYFTDLVGYVNSGIARASEVEDLGRTLQRAILPEKILHHMKLALNQAQRVNKKLRVRLRFGLDQAELSRIPWEYCHDGTGYLAVNGSTPFVRYLETNQPYHPIQAPEQTRVLIAVANPPDPAYADLEVEKELARIEPVMKQLGQGTQHKIIRNATKRDLTLALVNFRPHIFHFIGHGMVKRDGEGALVFEPPAGSKRQSDLMDADMITQVFRSTGTVKVVILNACLTAAEEAGQAIMAVAPRLIWSGVPAVVAMQFAVPDSTAITFSDDLYQSLAKGRPLDEAITHARLLAYVDNPVAWGIPVLFMRAPNGIIWQ